MIKGKIEKCGHCGASAHHMELLCGAGIFRNEAYLTPFHNKPRAGLYVILRNKNFVARRNWESLRGRTAILIDVPHL